MLDESGSIDTTSPAAQDAEAATTDVLARVAAPRRGRPRRAHEIDLTVKWDFYGHILADNGSKAVPMTPAAKRIAYILLTRYNHDDGYCYPGIESLMADTGYSRSQTIAGLSALAAHGWFTVQKRRNTSNRYTPNLAKVGLIGREKGHVPEVESPENWTPEVRKTGLPESGKVNPNPSKITQIIETHVSGQNESASRSVLQNERVGRASDRPTGFDREWALFRDLYPGRKDGDAWATKFRGVRMSGVSADVLMAGLDRYNRYLNSGVIDAPMHIAKYLSESRWEDKYAE